MTDKKTEALKLALEALEYHPGNYKLSKAECAEYIAVEDAIREALAEQPAQPSKPLTRKEIIKAQRSVDPEGQDLCGWSFTEGVRWAERHRGITGEQK